MGLDDTGEGTLDDADKIRCVQPQASQAPGDTDVNMLSMMRDLAGPSMTAEQARCEIDARFPELTVETIAPLAEGTDKVVFVVNGRYAFLFPKGSRSSKILSREVKITSQLRKHGSPATPQYEYVSDSSPENERCVAGCEMYRGHTLTPDTFQNVSDQEIVLSDLAAFLKNMHAFPLQEAAELGIDEENYQSTYQWYASEYFPKNVYPRLAAEDQEKIKLLFREYLENEENFRYQPALLHNDFKSDHIFTDMNTGRLEGVIDYEPMIGDPDHDFERLYDEFGASFLRRLLQHYSHSDPERCLRKVRLFRLCRIAQVAVNTAKGGNSDKSDEAWRLLRDQIAELA